MIKSIIVKLSRVYKMLKGKDIFFPVQYRCNKIKYGKKGADWTFCPDLINQTSIIYSFGVGMDISFELEMIEKYGVKIYAFDPTPKSIEWLNKQSLPGEFVFSPIGIAEYDGNALFSFPDNPDYVSGSMTQNMRKDNEKTEVKVNRLETIMKMYGHKSIDILKMDIEGAEYKVIDDIINTGIDIKQILFEIHHRFENLDIKDTKTAFRKLNIAGYKIFNISLNGEEYSFIKV
ncbi:MAG: FkbM family methyltransferase [Bacteroidota bacterium]|nr:FkbM family methyltransferase [Bacteroidota bacterium]